MIFVRLTFTDSSGLKSIHQCGKENSSTRSFAAIVLCRFKRIYDIRLLSAKPSYSESRKSRIPVFKLVWIRKLYEKTRLSSLAREQSRGAFSAKNRSLCACLLGRVRKSSLALPSQLNGLRRCSCGCLLGLRANDRLIAVRITSSAAVINLQMAKTLQAIGRFEKALRAT
jgi:hypothetical protein